MSFINSKLRYCVTCLIASSMLCALQDIFGQETLSLSVSGTPFELVWVPVDAPQGVKRIEIGDFSGKHPKEKKRSESIYAPFESNGKRGYYLGKTEVTEEQWASVVGQGPRSKLPVAGKTYTEIQLFIDKLNGMARNSGGMQRTPDGAEGFLKLPTEAEWEYAARGAEGASYADQDPYGGDLERYEVFSLPGSDGKAKEAASRPANALGLHDVLGNVRELMEGNYSVGGVAGGGLLLKGGSYLSEKGEIRSSSRTEQQRLGKDGQPSRRPDAGIRLCLSAEIFTSLGSKVPELESISGDDRVPDASAFEEQAFGLRERLLLAAGSPSPIVTDTAFPPPANSATSLSEEIPDPPSVGPDRTGYRKAAERGDADAQNNLGASYANGNGVPQNYALAVKWYGKSAKQNNSMAQKNLGVCYFNGQGVPQDFVEAYKWYAVAAANGEDIKAATYRDDAASRLSPAQLSKAQAEAAKLFEQLSKGR